MRKAETWDTTGDFDEEHTEMLTELADTDEDSLNGLTGGADNLREEDAAVLATLESLLDDSTWHPASIDVAAKRLLLRPGLHTQRIRRLRRRYLAALQQQVNLHDRPAGVPVNIAPVRNTAEAESDAAGNSEDTEGEEEGRACASDVMERVDVIIWNIDGISRHGASPLFLEEALREVGVAFLQEVNRRAISKSHVRNII